jgi:hypothetical protein
MRIDNHMLGYRRPPKFKNKGESISTFAAAASKKSSLVRSSPGGKSSKPKSNSQDVYISEKLVKAAYALATRGTL